VKYSQRVNLTLFHGTPYLFDIPSLGETKARKDFGRAIYLTSNKEQARKFALQKAERARSKSAWVNEYCLRSFNSLKICEFVEADEEWLRFIVANRERSVYKHSYDVVIGKVANDDTREVINGYAEHLYDNAARRLGITPEEFTIGELQPDRLVNQFAFCTQRAVAELGDLIKRIPAERR
jgi:hypothetical protein